ncbi:hypothetical protein Ptr902_10078 [Pyrenophora tritici-repentis]|uniref:Uncharacterized protein n=1 Tax=Pyrenophora tritici-repentis TaxID=45151 RepID=A0A834VKV7_9PLEO|nr:hypothetical protein PtrM4_049860 [Pyrenophora tritici-repentis]KAI0580736.1 hypothetical protein Alg215_05072 [Pyrenophora tritici-repentis]KAI0623735.1 hypothetical protein TUN199_04283 [Pyrenophora tritici-repentis]KAI2478465.1 hypothetical protein Ptr902_10078 [Pyrenophora tritici-repentis]
MSTVGEDTTIYIQNRYNEHMENARLRAIREAERAEELRRRPADYEEEELMGDREAAEGILRPQ